ncbi:MAG: hypothetical protein OXG44_06405 [Gammaproteobacteria bacterium]|nr:hypothetical protein [Gammaproteobacteria bacterium]
MGLNRLWRLHRGGIADIQAGRAPVGVWVERRDDSSLNTLGPVVQTQSQELRAVSSMTVRMRFRRDVTLASVFTDDTDRDWSVNEILPVERRRWLDVGLSRYEVAPDIPAIIPSDPAPSGFVAPDGWGVVNAEGAAVQTLQVTDVWTAYERHYVSAGRFLLPTRRELGHVWFSLLTPRYTGSYGSPYKWAATLRGSGGVDVPGVLAVQDETGQTLTGSYDVVATRASIGIFAFAPDTERGPSDEDVFTAAVESGDYVVIDSAP